VHGLLRKWNQSNENVVRDAPDEVYDGVVLVVFHVAANAYTRFFRLREGDFLKM
jgi:hypothetical protein